MKAIVSEFCVGTQRCHTLGSIESANIDMESPISSRITGNLDIMGLWKSCRQ
jgi:hypothetical protein